MPVCTTARGLACAGTGIGSDAERIDVGAQMLGQAHDDVEAPVALEHLAGLLAADGDLDDLLHVGHAEAVARQRGAVELRPSASAGRVTCSELHVGRARHAPAAPPATCAATDSSVSRSSPKTLTPTSLRTPEISSLKRIWIGCVNS